MATFSSRGAEPSFIEPRRYASDFKLVGSHHFATAHVVFGGENGLPKVETSVSAALWGFIVAFGYGVVFSMAFIEGHGSVLDLM